MSWRARFERWPLARRLLVAFALVAALPLTVVPLVLRAVTSSYDRSFARDLDEATRLVQAEVSRIGADVREKTIRAAAELGPEVARRLDEGEGGELVAGAEALRARTGLDVVEFVSGDGHVVFSGHLPARFGDADPLVARVAAAKRPVLVPIEVREGDEIVQRLALVTAVPAHAPEGALVLGGRLFNGDVVERLGELAGGEASLQGEGAVTRRPGRSLLGRFFGQARTVRTVELAGLDGARRLRIELSDTALTETKAGIAIGTIGAFLLAMAVGVALAAWLARRTVEPVQALVEATRDLAKGEFGRKVEVRAGGELGRLVEAFNTMSEELTRARERVARAERIAAWEQIARALAHEIKNPLTPIAMAIETLQRTKERQHPEFDRFFREGTATVLEEVGRLKRLATEFGEFARWPRPVTSPVPPAEIVRSAAALYSSLPEQFQVESHVDDGLSEVVADRDQMQRALVNLVKNAMEAMPEGGRITLRASRVADGVAFEVADTGPGLSPEVRAKLFEPYVTTKAEGTGLGLAIIHRIATEHGGRVEAADTPGGGTTFRIVLPTAGRAVA